MSSESCSVSVSYTHLDVYKRQLPYYLEALQRDPSNVDVNTQLGIYMIKRYRFDEAIAHLRKACALSLIHI